MPHDSLAQFIRVHRERLAPARVGLPDGQRRRAKGLRREELAALCDISPTWLTWIEQGRAPSVSAAVLARLAGALRLTPAEREYLFGLAGRHDPEAAAKSAGHAEQATMERAVKSVRAPSYVIDRDWNAVAWNRPAAALFAGWLDRRATERNLLRYMFLVPAARQLVDDWPARAARLVAEFRADAGSAIDAPVTRQRLDALRRDSHEFDVLWRRQDVLAREGGERVFNHPTQGRLALHQLTLRVANAPDLKLVMLV
jgi:transcriptional regulator with XRE-family HTH domain